MIARCVPFSSASSVGARATRPGRPRSQPTGGEEKALSVAGGPWFVRVLHADQAGLIGQRWIGTDLGRGGETVGPRRADVHDDHVRAMPGREHHGLGAVGGFGDERGARLRVLDDVSQGLLGDAVGRQVDAGRQVSNLALGDDSDVECLSIRPTVALSSRRAAEVVPAS